MIRYGSPMHTAIHTSLHCLTITVNGFDRYSWAIWKSTREESPRVKCVWIGAIICHRRYPHLLQGFCSIFEECFCCNSNRDCCINYQGSIQWLSQVISPLLGKSRYIFRGWKFHFHFVTTFFIKNKEAMSHKSTIVRCIMEWRQY